MRGQTNAQKDTSGFVTLGTEQNITSLKTFIFNDRYRIRSPVQDLNVIPSQTLYKLGIILQDKNYAEAGSLFHQIDNTAGTSSMILLCGQNKTDGTHIEGRLWINVSKSGTVDLILQGPNGLRTIASI